MLSENLFPILEFDSSRRAKIEPADRVKKENLPKACVITFFNELVS
jgi:hypothetical protein